MYYAKALFYFLLQYFGLVKGSRVGVMIDTSDSNCGFGRLSSFQEALTVSEPAFEV